MKIIAELIEDGLIADTGERTGKTKQVKIYKLIGVLGRENKRVPTTGYLLQESTDLKGTNVGTVPLFRGNSTNNPIKQYQRWDTESTKESIR